MATEIYFVRFFACVSFSLLLDCWHSSALSVTPLSSSSSAAATDRQTPKCVFDVVCLQLLRDASQRIYRSPLFSRCWWYIQLQLNTRITFTAVVVHIGQSLSPFKTLFYSLFCCCIHNFRQPNRAERWRKTKKLVIRHNRVSFSHCSLPNEWRVKADEFREYYVPVPEFNCMFFAWVRCSAMKTKIEELIKQRGII